MDTDTAPSSAEAPYLLRVSKNALHHNHICKAVETLMESTWLRKNRQNAIQRSAAWFLFRFAKTKQEEYQKTSSLVQA